MPRREADVSTLTVPVTVRERLLLDELRGALAFDSDANLVRTALHFYASFQMPQQVDLAMFQLRHGTSREFRQKQKASA